MRQLCSLMLLGIFLMSCQTVATVPPATPTPAPATPTSPAATSTAAVPTASATPTVRATVMATATQAPTVTPLGTVNGSLTPFQPLRNDQIVDRPFRKVRALTDGTRPYKIAAWSPVGTWIAATPQDGPGIDIIDVVTGKVTALVTDTFVLEPVWGAWTAGDQGFVCVLVSTVRDERWGVDCWLPDGSRSKNFVTDAPLVRSPVLLADTLAYSTDAAVLVNERGSERTVAAQPALTLALNVAVTPPRLAWVPSVANLEGVQVLVQSVDGEPALQVAAPGEGWWLPRWSDVGARLAVTNIGGRIGSIAGDGAQRRDLGPGDTPAWSPDGERLAFAGSSAGEEYTTRDIHVVDWQGNGPRLRLTDANDEQFFVSPSWSPDGTQIAFVEIDTGQIFVGNAPTNP